MSHQTRFLTYPCQTTERQIQKDLNRFAYDPQESSSYHGRLTFHREPVYKNIDEAEEAINKMIRGDYDDHAVRFRVGRRINWLVKVEWHC